MPEKSVLTAEDSTKAEKNWTEFYAVEASHAFTSAIKDRLDYVCVCYCQLMYHKTVQAFQKSKYDKAPSEFVIPESVYWTKGRFARHVIMQGLLPAQAKANNLALDDIPVELSDLNPLEIRLISSLSEDGSTSLWQAACHSRTSCQCPHWCYSCVHSSTKASISNTDDSNEAKEKAVLQGTLYQYIRPAKIIAALQWLKLNNPLYRDVQIHNDWLCDAAEDDAEIWEALSAEHCPPPPSSPTVTITATLSQGEHFILHDCRHKYDNITLAYSYRWSHSLAWEAFRLGTYQGMVIVSFQKWQCNWTSLVSGLVRWVWGSSLWSTCRPIHTHDGSSHFREYIPTPVISDDPSNTDTEAPSQQDEFFNSIEDPRLHQQLRWLRYLEHRCLQAWAYQGNARVDHTPPTPLIV